MSQQEMKIKVEFPEWNNLSRPVQSLISFYMEDATYEMCGETDHGEIVYLSNAIRYKKSCFQYMIGDYQINSNSVYVYISEVYPVDKLLILHNTDEDLSYYIYPQLELPQFETDTSLTKINTKLSLYRAIDNGDYDWGIEQSQTNLTTPVILTPLINEQENQDDSLVPAFEIDTSSYEDHYYFSDIDTSNKQINYDFQLRTSSFIISIYDEHSDSYQQKSVHFKIGICPVASEESELSSMDDCVNVLKNKYLSMSEENATGCETTLFDLVSKGLETNDYKYFLGGYLIFDLASKYESDSYYEGDFFNKNIILPYNKNDI